MAGLVNFIMPVFSRYKKPLDLCVTAEADIGMAGVLRLNIVKTSR